MKMCASVEIFRFEPDGECNDLQSGNFCPAKTELRTRQSGGDRWRCLLTGREIGKRSQKCRQSTGDTIAVCLKRG